MVWAKVCCHSPGRVGDLCSAALYFVVASGKRTARRAGWGVEVDLILATVRTFGLVPPASVHVLLVMILPVHQRLLLVRYMAGWPGADRNSYRQGQYFGDGLCLQTDTGLKCEWCSEVWDLTGDRNEDAVMLDGEEITNGE